MPPSSGISLAALSKAEPCSSGSNKGFVISLVGKAWFSPSESSTTRSDLRRLVLLSKIARNSSAARVLSLSSMGTRIVRGIFMYNESFLCIVEIEIE